MSEEAAHGLQVGVTPDGRVVLEFARDDGAVLVTATMISTAQVIDLCNRLLDAVDMVRAGPLSMIETRGNA